MPILSVGSPVADRSLISLSRVKAELEIEGTGSDVLLSSWIVAASDRIADICGLAADQTGRRTFLREEAVVTFAAGEIGRGPMILPWRIPVEITALSVGDTVLAADEFETISMAALVFRIGVGGDRIDWEEARVTVSLTLGWPIESLPTALSDVVMAMVAGRWYARDRGDPSLRSYESPDVEKMSWFDPDKMVQRDGMSADTAALLDPYRNPVIA